MKIRELSMLYALAAMSDLGSTPKQKIDLSKQRNIEPPIPKGCKVYWFTQDGVVSFTEPKQPIVSYKIIALNEKSARRKFKNLNLPF